MSKIKPRVKTLKEALELLDDAECHLGNLVLEYEVEGMAREALHRIQYALGMSDEKPEDSDE